MSPFFLRRDAHTTYKSIVFFIHFIFSDDRIITLLKFWCGIMIIMIADI